MIDENTKIGATSSGDIQPNHLFEPYRFNLLRHEHVVAERDALKAELDAVMQLGVDKWLEGDELKENPATRAAKAREKVLKSLDALKAEVERLKNVGRMVVKEGNGLYLRLGERHGKAWRHAFEALEQALRGEG